MSRKAAPDGVRFMPAEGLVTGLAVKEAVKALLDDGYFDKAKNAVIGVSNDTDYDVRWSGQRFDCWGLTAALNDKLNRA